MNGASPTDRYRVSEGQPDRKHLYQVVLARHALHFPARHDQLPFGSTTPPITSTTPSTLPTTSTPSTTSTTLLNSQCLHSQWSTATISLFSNLLHLHLLPPPLQAMLCYWFTSNSFSLLLAIFFRQPSVRSFFEIPPLVDHSQAFTLRKGTQAPQPSFMESFKQSESIIYWCTSEAQNSFTALIHTSNIQATSKLFTILYALVCVCPARCMYVTIIMQTAAR